ncbi:MAG: hypothetical protein ABSF88_13385 [Candidatus Aminicenantales bacterium]
MRTKKLIAPILIAGFAFSLLVMPSLAAPQAQEKQEKKDVKQPAAKVFIPKDVRDILLKNLPTRQIREDIPFTIFRSSFLPAQSAFYIFLYLKMKNADLGYAAAIAPQAAAAATSAAAPATVKATFDVFLQFHKMENGQPTQILKEVYVPTTQEQDAAGYDPAKEDWYTVGYPLPAGQYLVAMAVTTHDLKKIGTQYYEFSLPDIKALKELDTTPVYFLKDYKELPAAEQVAALHRNFLRYSILQISPNIENVISPGDPLDLFFLILGAQPNDQNKYAIECQYGVKQGDKEVIKFAVQNYETPFISQPVPLKQTLITKDKDGKENQEMKDLSAGSYTFTIKLTDKISGRTGAKSVDFTVK